MKKYIQIALCLLIPLVTGIIGAIASTSSIGTWYTTINKPFFNPPNELFGPVWSILYILMGVSFYRILQSPASEIRTKAIAISCLQLFLNFCWSFIFFKFRQIDLALIEIITLWISIATMIYLFSKINKTAAYLQIPYLLLVSFATILNASIWYLN